MRLFKFKHVVGNTTPKNVMMKSLESEKFSNLSLFSGPTGTGKSTSAEIAGMRLVCNSPEGAEPCGKCNECKSAMNVILNDGKGRRFKKINIAAFRDGDDFNNMVTEVFKIDTGTETVVYIFEEFHTLSQAKQTALLEEFDKLPANVFVIICTSAPNQVIPELRDRCRQFKFGTLSPSSMRMLIDQESKRTNLKLSNNVIGILQSHSRGVPRRLVESIKLLADELVTNEDELADFLKETNPDDLRNLFKLFGDLSEYIKSLELLIERSSIPEFIRSSKSYLMELSFISKGVKQRDTYLKPEDKMFAEILGFENILRMFNEIKKLSYNSEISDVQFCFIKCSLVLNKAFSSNKDLSDSLIKVNSTEKSIQSKELRDSEVGSLNQFKKITESSLKEFNDESLS